ncbi:IPP transferase-domain-containing protein [Xylariaceae sp. FL0255]|nr:IPP transferase-domain-containing protein [Xylariaceae sp. FL0255]
MAASRAPHQPLVTIIGTTGTGKSDLAVDLAVRFNGEIINADAMQMYRGLPVITNQISVQEQRGIPHHLLAHIDPLEPTWVSGIFAREARRLIQEIRSRGKLPIIVGGTMYYVHALLFEGHSVSSADAVSSSDPVYRPQEESRAAFPILEQSGEVMHERLRQVDPVMAARWHPSEERKIRRSLEIFLTTGRKASDIYAEQMMQRTDSLFLEARDPWETLVFWVYSDREVLTERLSKRVDKMVRAGLMDEVRELHRRRLGCLERGEVIDRTRGIWQSIGYKQMEPYLNGELEGKSDEDLVKLRDAGLEDINVATRKYAKAQMQWIRIKSARAFKEHGAMDSLYLLDSTDAEAFSEHVLDEAAGICESFLAGDEDRVKANEVSETARELLGAFESESRSEKEVFRIRECEVCAVKIYTEKDWAKHLQGRNHRRVVKKKTRVALVPVEVEADAEEEGEARVRDNGEEDVNLVAENQGKDGVLAGSVAAVERSVEGAP